jgi:UDP-GlcNAc:undecaprenyl-phosphate/decaprenyl-phosphate GlcNAc-1-phosphate transferase
LRARTKLAVEVLAAGLLVAAGGRIEAIHVEGLFRLELGLWGWIIAGLWLVGVTNAVNLIDGLDGLAGGISAIACGVIAILAVLGGNVVLAVLMLALLGALSGFLCFNFNPARIFLGDSGSLFIGFMLAGASLLTVAKSHALVGLALPILVLGIPIFDTFCSVLRRFLERRGVMSPDRGHFHHRLLRLGFRQHQVAILAYLVTLVVSGLGFFMVVTRGGASVVVFLCCLLILLLVFRVVGSVRLRETLAGLQHRKALRDQCRQERMGFEEAQLELEEANQFEEWWELLCRAADRLDVERLALDLTNRDGTPRQLRWRRAGRSNGVRVVEVSVPITDRRRGSSLKLEVSLVRDGSLESVGRRMTYLTRLLEEYGLDRLDGSDRPAAGRGDD